MGYLVFLIISLIIISLISLFHTSHLICSIAECKLAIKNDKKLFIRYNVEMSDNYKRNIITYRTMVITYYILIFFWLFFIVIFSKLENQPYKQSKEIQTRKEKIEYKLSYYDKLFYDYVDEAKLYNEYVNRGNNKFCRFKVEDRTEYMINIDFYINEFNNR